MKAALAEVPEHATHVAVHDAARPVTPQDVIDRVFVAAGAHAGVIPAVPVADTLKRLGEEAEGGGGDPLAAILGTGEASPPRRVTETIDRAELALVQTPQVFETGLLRRAYGQDDLSSTDDAGLVERIGEPVVAVEGDPLNIKITRPGDVELARIIGGFRKASERPSHKRF